MEVSNDLIKAVENRNLLRVKLILKNSFIIDPTGETFNKLLEFTLNRIPDLFDNHDGELFKEEENWTEGYFNEETVKIIDNFSKERVLLLKAMADKLFNKKVIYQSSIHHTNNRRRSYFNFIYTRLVIGASLALAGIVWLGYIVTIKQASIVTILISAALIGVGGSLLFNKK
jgi:hypothetical protein